MLPCDDPGATSGFFVDRLGFRVDAVRPAEDPDEITISGHGVRVTLARGLAGDPGTLRLRCAGADAVRVLMAPNGTRIELIGMDAPLRVPALEPALAIALAKDARWVVGRAGMEYRDLIDDRQGGRFVASQIRIRDGGPVPDYVHFHRVRFQMIYCRRGWVRVVYEDQGEPLVMREGDCVLQPPEIRHRVLECSAGLEVVEVSCPAAHETLADHELGLPTAERQPERRFGGQRFVHHVAAEAAYVSGAHAGLEARDTGLAAATDGLAGARVLRPSSSEATDWLGRHDGELRFWFVLDGALELRLADRVVPLGPADAVTIPRGLPHAPAAWSEDLALLEVTLPGALRLEPEVR
ncbi:MAG: cupin domain-containing protein [Sandaracinaceae bacterium]|nr:cupin domain-containing protein [Sandaracinaceae bacterium]